MIPWYLLIPVVLALVAIGLSVLWGGRLAVIICFMGLLGWSYMLIVQNFNALFPAPVPSKLADVVELTCMMVFVVSLVAWIYAWRKRYMSRKSAA